MMKKNLIFIGLLAVGISFTACEEDELNDLTSLPDLDSRVRFEFNGETIDFDCFATFTEGYDDFTEKEYLEIAIQDNFLGSESFYLVYRLESDQAVFGQLETSKSYELAEMFSEADNTEAFLVGLTWYGEDRNSILFPFVDTGSILFSSINQNRLNGRSSFTLTAPSGEEIKLRVSVIVAKRTN